MDGNNITDIIDDSQKHSVYMNINADLPLVSLISEGDIAKRKKQRLHLKYLIESLDDVFYSHQVFPHDFIITDEEGWVLLIKECGKDYARIIQPGMCLAEDMIGTNGVGLTLKHENSIKVVASQHHNKRLHNQISFGVPLTYNKKLIGSAGFVISIDNTELERSVMEGILNAINVMAENMLNTRESVHELLIIKQFMEKSHSSKAVIAVDASLRIVQANNSAKTIIGMPVEEITSQPVSKFIPDIERLILEERTKKKLIINTITCNKSVNFVSSPVNDALEQCVGWIIEFDLPVTDKPRKKSTLFNFEDIIGNSTAIKKLLNIARIVAGSSASVLITGESGTGKELLAQSIHSASSVNKGAFVALNCSAIPVELIESELFGYVEGAFTGSRKGGMQGKFMQANNGTLFLDEIGDMPLELQPKILRVIQEQQVLPLGSSHTMPVNVRIIAATNQNLEKMISNGLFRSDLYYRINVVELLIPALRHRKEDIQLLVNYFIKKYNDKLGKNVSSISNQAMMLLNHYDWPGNIRELENIVQYSITMTTGNRIEVEHTPYKIYSLGPALNEEDKTSASDYDLPWQMAEKQSLIQVMENNGGNISKAAQEFGVSRATFYRRLQDYKLIDDIKRIRAR